MKKNTIIHLILIFSIMLLIVVHHIIPYYYIKKKNIQKHYNVSNIDKCTKCQMK